MCPVVVNFTKVIALSVVPTPTDTATPTPTPTPTPTVTIPGQVTNFRVTTLGNGSVTAAWDPPFTAYRVLMWTETNRDGRIDSISYPSLDSALSRTVTVSGLTLSPVYHLFVQARNTAGTDEAGWGPLAGPKNVHVATRFGKELSRWNQKRSKASSP